MDPYAVLTSFDQQSVIGMLKATGSRDPDVLHSRKMSLISQAKMPKLLGLGMIIVGAAMTITIIGALVGVPMMLGGWWFRRRGSKSIAAIESGFEEFVGASAS